MADKKNMQITLTDSTGKQFKSNPFETIKGDPGKNGVSVTAVNGSSIDGENSFRLKFNFKIGDNTQEVDTGNIKKIKGIPSNIIKTGSITQEAIPPNDKDEWDTQNCTLSIHLDGILDTCQINQIVGLTLETIFPEGGDNTITIDNSINGFPQLYEGVTSLSNEYSFIQISDGNGGLIPVMEVSENTDCFAWHYDSKNNILNISAGNKASYDFITGGGMSNQKDWILYFSYLG